LAVTILNSIRTVSSPIVSLSGVENEVKMDEVEPEIVDQSV
jgi:hypothetical protein